MNTKVVKTSILILILCLIIFTPLASFAQEDGLVPKCNTEINTATGEFSDPCNFDQLILLIGNIIDFLLFKLAMPLAAILFTYAGFLYLASGAKPQNKETANKIFWNAFLGFVIALAAWLIVQAILLGLGIKPGFSLLEGIGQ